MRTGFVFALGISMLLLFRILPAQAASLSDDEAMVAAQIKRLHDANRSTRAEAAAILRRIVAKYPNGTANLREADAGKARWEKTLRQVKRGMTKVNFRKYIPSATEELNIGSGQSHTISYRLDPHWRCSVSYENRDDTVIGVGELKRWENGVGVPPPKHFTGTWTSWYINGQKLCEIQYTDGKYDGTYSRFYDNGQKMYEQHYTQHTANGTDTGWYPDGKRSYQGVYKNDKQDGIWTHWYQDGSKRVETTYRDGVNDGPDIAWYENGQKERETTYRNGKKHGIEAAWNRQGSVEYRHEYKDGEVIN